VRPQLETHLMIRIGLQRDLLRTRGCTAKPDRNRRHPWQPAIVAATHVDIPHVDIIRRTTQSDMSNSGVGDIVCHR
jgi:hypothetical protein